MKKDMMIMNEEIEKHEKLGYKHFIEDFGNKYKVERSWDGCYFDLLATALTDTGRTYVIEIKDYSDPEHPRPYSKYENYQIDLEKIEHLCESAKLLDRIPILYCHFSDCSIIWRPDKIDYESRKKRMKVNKYGVRYGRKEFTNQTYFYKDEATYIKEWES